MYTSFTDWEQNSLAHHGVIGMKWGVRRYRNKDGTLTPAGKRHEQKEFYKTLKQDAKQELKAYKTRGKKGNRDYEASKAYLKETDAVKKLHKSAKEVNELVDQCENMYRQVAIRKEKTGKGPSAKEKKQYFNLVEKRNKALDEWRNSIKTTTKELLGKYANRKLTTQSDLVFFKSKDKASWLTFNAIASIDFDEQSKKR